MFWNSRMGNFLVDCALIGLGQAGRISDRVPSCRLLANTSKAALLRINSMQPLRCTICRVLPETQSDCAALSAFQAAPRKTIITENSIHTIKPIAAATPL